MTLSETTIETQDNEALSDLRHRLALALKDGQEAVSDLYYEVCAVLRARKVFV